jgi:septation ring formation regulator EzrA
MIQEEQDLLKGLQKEIDKVKWKTGKFEIRYSEFTQVLEGLRDAMDSILTLKADKKYLENQIEQLKKDPVKPYSRIVYKKR